ncbi:hypothetical protein STENM327S_02944 [Streptomyces tendae]
MPAQPVEPVIDGVVRGFDQPVGVEHQRGVRWQDGDGIGARSADSCAEEWLVACPGAGLTVVGDEERRRWPAFVQRRRHRALFLRVSLARIMVTMGTSAMCITASSSRVTTALVRPWVGRGEGAQHVADLSHAGCGVEIVSDDIADGQCVGVANAKAWTVTAHG